MGYKKLQITKLNWSSFRKAFKINYSSVFTCLWNTWCVLWKSCKQKTAIAIWKKWRKISVHMKVQWQLQNLCSNMCNTCFSVLQCEYLRLFPAENWMHWMLLIFSCEATKKIWQYFITIRNVSGWFIYAIKNPWGEESPSLIHETICQSQFLQNSSQENSTSK